VTLVQQLLAAAARHDAVTGQALELHRLLEGWGYASEVAAEHVQPALAGIVRPLERLSPEPDAVILRYSIWSAAADAALESGPRRLGLVYHNVTPPDFLRAVNPTLARLCHRARSRLELFAEEAHLAMADSAYNARELEEEGFEDVRVVPLLLRPQRRAARDPEGPPVVLTVGRVAPNKRLELLLRAFALFQRAHAPEARLVLIGSWEGFEPYRDALDRLLDRLGARGVRFLGVVDDAERDRWYDEAAAYACASAHEGFCAPLVEAMAAGLPVVAVGAAAVPETLGEGGLVLPDDDPCVFAEALAAVTADPALRAALRAGAERRLAELAPERVAEQLRAAVEELAGPPGGATAAGRAAEPGARLP
jgi:glycosyltransferase involved in cell wall biosynthesis